jgi:hypothetical protein
VPPKNPKVKKVLPELHGEKWRLIDGSEVTVLEKIRKGFIRCLTVRGFLKVVHQNNFKERLA